jgi:hypothetical protein
MKIIQRTLRKARGERCARIRLEYDNGKTREVLRTVESKGEAKTKLAQLEVEILEKGRRDWRQVRLRSGSLLNT